jgi:hypothetical protein
LTQIAYLNVGTETGHGTTYPTSFLYWPATCLIAKDLPRRVRLGRSGLNLGTLWLPTFGLGFFALRRRLFDLDLDCGASDYSAS